MEIPDVEYARSGDVAIAYQVVGDGPADIVFARGFSGELLSMWEHPLPARHVVGLAEIGRVLMIDKQGTGLSDRTREVATLETRMDDLRVVMDAVGSQRAVFWGAHEAARLAILFAATDPERTAGVISLEPWVRGRKTDDYPWRPTRTAGGVVSRTCGSGGAGATTSWSSWRRGPRRRGRRGVRRLVRRPYAAEHEPGCGALLHALMESDVADVLSAVRVPMLILFKPSERGPAEYVAERVPRCKLVELPRLRGVYTWIDDETHAASMTAIGRFVPRVGKQAQADRVLATILFTDMVGSSERATELGDQAWRDLLRAHHTMIRRLLTEFRGEELDVAGDGLLAAFDGPGRAIRCACAIRGALRDLGLEVRAGVHTGECERLDGKLSGVAVHVGDRVASAAAPGEVLVSSTVKDLVAGSGITFQDRGDHELKGVGAWRLYSVVNA